MSHPTPSTALWTPEQAHVWFKAQPLALGANFVPASAINQLAMWQADSFDPERIDLELGWAQNLGMNTMRVFLHDLLWERDATGFKQRIDQYLGIAERHGIFTMFVLFDSCWDPEPRLGPQREPIPGVHNSGWVQSPSASQLGDRRTWPQLRAYVEGIVDAFGKDPRVTYWDIWNEPDNQGGGMGYYLPREAKDKVTLVAELITQAFEWARAQDPIQPLTSGLWLGDDWSPGSSELNAVQHAQLACSDVVSFHDYSWAEKFEMRIHQLQKYGRPLICTEYMARSLGSTFDHALPIAAREDVGMLNWGFVDGKSQTKMPWDSWKRPYAIDAPLVWFHDVLHADGTPYRLREAELLRQYGARKR